MKLRGWTYVERSNGAVAFDVDEHTIYFHGQRVVAVRIGTDMFRTDTLKGGIVYQRIRAAINGATGIKHVHMASNKELLQHAETVLALAVSRAFDERLLGE